MTARPPLIGVTTDLAEHPSGLRVFSYMTYVDAIAAAGGLPVLLAPVASSVGAVLERCDAFVLAGGDDPRTEAFGQPTHPKATPVHPERQAFEVALLRELEQRRPDAPVLGVCLGMQMMALLAGGRLDQHLPETRASHAMHWESEHPVAPTGELRSLTGELRGRVRSKHRQAVDDPGGLVVAARAPDGVIEAVGDPARRFYVGVQWHPERTAAPAVGGALFGALVAACR